MRATTRLRLANLVVLLSALSAAPAALADPGRWDERDLIVKRALLDRREGFERFRLAAPVPADVRGLTSEQWLKDQRRYPPIPVKVGGVTVSVTLYTHTDLLEDMAVAIPRDYGPFFVTLLRGRYGQPSEERFWHSKYVSLHFREGKEGLTLHYHSTRMDQLRKARLIAAAQRQRDELERAMRGVEQAF